MFDVRVVDTDQRSYRGKELETVLTEHEAVKKTKYLRACHEARKSFVPLVTSVDKLMAKEHVAATRRLAGLLSQKWGRHYSEVC